MTICIVIRCTLLSVTLIAFKLYKLYSTINNFLYHICISFVKIGYVLGEAYMLFITMVSSIRVCYLNLFLKQNDDRQ